MLISGVIGEVDEKQFKNKRWSDNFESRRNIQLPIPTHEQQTFLTTKLTLVHSSAA